MKTIEIVAALAALTEAAQAQVVEAADHQRQANAAIASLEPKPKRRGRGPAKVKAAAPAPAPKKKTTPKKAAKKSTPAIPSSFSE